MPPRQLSRFALSTAVASNAGTNKIILTERVAYRFRALSDTVQHQVHAGDTLQSLAARYYSSMGTRERSPAELWWVLADFQPDPIHDPTLQLEPGTVFYVPSQRVVLTEIFAEQRRESV